MTLTLDEPHSKTALQQAAARGQSPEQYVQALIDADARTFDQILEPVRHGFETMADDELDDLLTRANAAARKTT